MSHENENRVDTAGMPVVSEERIVQALAGAFGADKVFPPNQDNLNSFTVHFSRKETSEQIMRLLGEAMPDLFVFVYIGAFTHITGDELSITLGFEETRAQAPELNAEAQELVTYLETHQARLRLTAADLERAPTGQGPSR